MLFWESPAELDAISPFMPFALERSKPADNAVNSPSNSAGDYQNSMDLSPKTGNPIGVLLFSLLFLIVIPLRNR